MTVVYMSYKANMVLMQFLLLNCFQLRSGWADLPSFLSVRMFTKAFLLLTKDSRELRESRKMLNIPEQSWNVNTAE